MLNQAYAIRQFHENISQTSTIKETIALIKQDPQLDLLLKITSLPLDLTHDFGTDSLTGSGQITLLPKLYLSGELFECRPSHMLMPPSFDGLESAFMKTLKESITTTQKVWG